MLRQLRLLIPVLLAAGVAPVDDARASCDAAEAEIVRERALRCPDTSLKLICNGSSINIRDSGEVCCAIRPEREIEARCGTDEVLEIKCRRGATAVLVQATEGGLVYACMKPLPPVEDPPPEPGFGEGDEGSSSDGNHPSMALN